MPYDVLIVASGARPVEPFPAATAFTGSLTDQERLHGIVQDVEERLPAAAGVRGPAGQHVGPCRCMSSR